jgi:general secretion pathway protein C
MKRWPLITTFVLFVALCISAAYWAMQLFKPPLRAVAAPPQISLPAPKPDAAAGLLGGHSNAVVASNFQLKGVVVASNPAESVAILAANGKSAKAIRTNAEVVPGVTVKEVNRHYVLLLEGGVVKRVELPADAKAQMKVGISTNATGAGSPPANHPGLSNSSTSVGKYSAPSRPLQQPAIPSPQPQR